MRARAELPATGRAVKFSDFDFDDAALRKTAQDVAPLPFAGKSNRRQRPGTASFVLGCPSSSIIRTAKSGHGVELFPSPANGVNVRPEASSGGWRKDRWPPAVENLGPLESHAVARHPGCGLEPRGLSSCRTAKARRTRSASLAGVAQACTLAPLRRYGIDDPRSVWGSPWTDSRRRRRARVRGDTSAKGTARFASPGNGSTPFPLPSSRCGGLMPPPVPRLRFPPPRRFLGH